jgi:nucleotide-binding universal stress UspA family protein
MTTTGGKPTPEAGSTEPVFKSVLCGIRRSRGDAEAARQAALLAGPSPLYLMCAWYEAGSGLNAKATLTEEAAKQALAKARRTVLKTCADVHVDRVLAESPVELLLEEGPQHDLVVVGDHQRHRMEGIVAGTVVTHLAHRLTVPLLVARKAEREFPTHIVVASDGSGSAHTAVRVAGQLARRHGTTLTLVHVEGADDAHLRKGLELDSAALLDEAGVEPAVVKEHGDPVEAIVRLAGGEGASIAVVGSRGVTGVKALGSVSERVVHNAPCSVLVTRHP